MSYTVYEDLDSGRDGSIHPGGLNFLGHFRTEEDAVAYIKKLYGITGCDGRKMHIQWTTPDGVDKERIFSTRGWVNEITKK